MPNIITYDHLINLHASVGDLPKAIGSFDLIESGKYLEFKCYFYMIYLILFNYFIFSRI